MIPASANPLFLSSDAPTGYNLTKSLRFRNSASPYLSRTPSTTGTGQGKTWTYSIWAKLDVTAKYNWLLIGGLLSSSADCALYIDNVGQMKFNDRPSGAYLNSAAVYRDPSAWYHFIFAVDTTQSTSSNRIKMYVNGVQTTSFADINYPSQNTVLNIGINQPQRICTRDDGNTSSFHIAEANFIDGQQLTPSSFGETDAITGVWKPKLYSGTYGTNGFYLPFTDIATTSGSNAGLGKDFSGNGNYFNTTNISITSGVTYDSMKDVPTLTDENTANYAVLNPLDVSGSGITLSSGNLNATCSTGSTYYFAKASLAIPTSGGFYWETTISTVGQFPIVGIQPTSRSNSNSGSVYLGYYSDEISWFGGLNEIYQNGVNILSVSSVSNGDVIMVAHNAGKTWIGKNGTWFNSGNPAAGTGNIGSTLSGQLSAAICLRGSTAPVVDANFGQRPFAYTPPTGFKALNTYNLPDSTIVAGNSHFDATLYTGNGSTQTITNAGGFKPDLVWLKQRNPAVAAYNLLYDSVRGATKWLSSNETAAEGTIASSLTAFNNNGFSVSTDPSGSNTGWNATGGTMVAWQWQAGQGTTSTNTAGSQTSIVSVNTTAGFSIVTFTMAVSGVSTVGHGLGVAPKFIVMKARTGSVGWGVYHHSIGNGAYLVMNLTQAAQADSNAWNNTSPTSSVWTIGTSFNGGLGDYVAYCWSEVAGFSKFGKITGNASADNTFIYTGFKPKFIILKSTGNDSWYMYDSSRNQSNVVNSILQANSSSAESTSTAFDFLSNGIKFRSAGWSGDYVYACFAENPFKNSLAR